MLYTHKIQGSIDRLKEKTILEAKIKYNIKCSLYKKVKKLNKKLKKIKEYLRNFRSKIELNEEKSLRTDKIFLKFKKITDKKEF